MEDKQSFKELIRSNIQKSGIHVTIVIGGIEPRYAYSIGLYEQFKFEIVLAGAILYLKDEVLQIFNGIHAALRSNGGSLDQNIVVGDLGGFSFRHVDESWSKMMLLGAFDHYKADDIPVYQILPDQAHYTFDIPDMSRAFDASTEPIWQYLTAKWPYQVSEKSMVVTNLDALKGLPITELTRWEDDDWQMFAGPGPDVAEDDMRVITLGTMLGIDNSILPALELQNGKGLYRTDRDEPWNKWGW